jgi:phosphate transport system protein
MIMIRECYRKQLNKLVDSVMDMGNLVIGRIKIGLQALGGADEELIKTLEEGDEEIDELYLQIEKLCTDLLATQQPVAIDLRVITASFKIVTDLERIADIAVNLGQYSRFSTKIKIVSKEDLFEIGDLALGMLYDSLKAYYDRDVPRAEEVVDLDDEVDERCWKLTSCLIKGIMDHKGNKETAASVVRVLLSIRDLERVADHAVNIAARTVYMCESRKDYI